MLLLLNSLQAPALGACLRRFGMTITVLLLCMPSCLLLLLNWPVL